MPQRKSAAEPGSGGRFLMDLVQCLVLMYLVASKCVYLCEERGVCVKLNRHVKCFQIFLLNI